MNSATAPISRRSNGGGLSASQGQFPEDIEQAFQLSQNNRVTVNVTPARFADVVWLETSLMPAAGATNIKNMGTSVQGDLTRAGLEFIMEDSSLESVQVTGPAKAPPGPGEGGNGGGGGGTTESSFFSGALPWIFGGLVVGGVALQLTSRAAKRKMDKAASSRSGSRSNPNGMYEVEIEIETGEPTDPETPISIHNVLVEEWEDMTDVPLDSPSRPGRERTPRDGSIEQGYPFDSREAAEEFASMARRYAADLTGPELGKDSPGSFSVEVEKKRSNPSSQVRFEIPDSPEALPSGMTQRDVKSMVVSSVEASGGTIAQESSEVVVAEFDDEATASAVSRDVTEQASREGVSHLFVSQMPRMNPDDSFAPMSDDPAIMALSWEGGDGNWNLTTRGGKKFAQIVEVGGTYTIESRTGMATRSSLESAKQKGRDMVRGESRVNPAEGESGGSRGNDSANKGDSAEFWVARSTVDKDDLDRGNVHRTSVTGNLPSLDMSEQRRIASNLAVAPSGQVTVYRNSSKGLQEQGTFRWRPDDGFSKSG